MCEVVRSGINTVPSGQAEAARSIGLTFTQNLSLVILPQALRSVVGPMGSTLIALTKNTSVAVGFSVLELSSVVSQLNETGDAVAALFGVAHLLPRADPGDVVRVRGARAEGGIRTMSGASVLFDAPGPRARRRNAILTVIGALLVVAILGVVVLRLADNGQLDGVRWEWLQYERIQRNIFIDGLTATLKAFVISAVLSVVVGLILSIGRLSTNRWLRYPAVLFVTVFRALPVVVLMFIPYFAGSSVFGESIPLLWCVVFGLVVYNSSVLAEIFRAGVLAVPKGQSEAAASIGLSRSQTLRIVLFPQAIRTMLPTIISQLVVVLKDTALGFVIGYEELLVKGQEVARDPSFRLPYIPVAIVIGAVYIVLCSLLSWLAVYVERRTGSRRRPRRAFDTGVGEPVPGDAVLDLPV